MFFFFKLRTAYEMRISDWSSDVCSSDLPSQGGLRSSRPPASRLRNDFRLQAVESTPGRQGGGPMAARPIWRGQIRLALVSIPVEIYPATRRDRKRVV